ncbi:MAG TPA: 3'(2'),5'-bisphosphate nucleotidase CysQ, partial [Saprospiraceae bacterium]|nr:3'(2'),5'-bisphosphate nucleotidase CysQ [Saprospiraceae bacterium]
ANPILKEVGSSLKFMLLASGEADYYPRMSPTMEWDIAASQIILEEAGGSIISEYTKQAVVYNKENLRNPHFKAYGRRI